MSTTAWAADLSDDEFERELRCRLRVLLRLQHAGLHDVPIHLARDYALIAETLPPAPHEEERVEELAGGQMPAQAAVEAHSASDKTATQPASKIAISTTTGAPADANRSKRNSATRDIVQIATPAAGGYAEIVDGNQSVKKDSVNTRAVGTPIGTSKKTAPPSQSTFHRPKSRQDKSRKSRIEPFAPTWTRATQKHRFSGTVHSAERRGGYAVSLDFSDLREATLRDSNDPTRLLSTYLNREMKKAFGQQLPYSFIFEVAPDTGKLHMHGVIIPIDNSEQHRKRLVRALRAAGGLRKGSGAARQCKLKPLKGAGGWARYSILDRGRTRRDLGREKLIFISQPMRTIARGDWNELRYG